MAPVGNFDQPILHGLCTMGHATRQVINGVASGDSTKLKSIKAHFPSPVYPGETIETSVWIDKTNPHVVIFTARVVERNVVVLSNTLAEFSCKLSPSIQDKAKL
ncbi:hypothetical protein BB558_004698 [Smittium angustum]|uniref:MaoC-like domain-containing protein n=1 Tax=Smittium angustum TaxID=133377 RepID=A0A2U1J2P6_SMIAN|nr:hypothetical protein BB558_004698 [Smittium angustum]